MSLIQISENLLVELVESLKKAAPLKRPETYEELELIKAWVTASSYVLEILEPVAHKPGIDSEVTYWSELRNSYQAEIRAFKASQ